MAVQMRVIVAASKCSLCMDSVYLEILLFIMV